MKTPPILSTNIIEQYKTDWFVTESTIENLYKNYVYQDKPIGGGDMHAGCYVGIHKEDFDAFARGSKKYRVVLVCEAVLKKVRARK